MTRAAVYCRVSTDNQEREGTSLQTQAEACLTYCQTKGYEVAYRFSEAYSGLSLERPELDKLRELVRAEAIDVIVCYSLDRLTRDPGHGVIITQELEKHQAQLETVTETVDTSELGKLISYIRGFAGKLEAEKIKERTLRGKKARAKEGRIVGGSGKGLYGYDYIKVNQDKGGRRVINEAESKWVKEIFLWLVNEGLTSHAIARRLTALGIPSKTGGTIWNSRSVVAILKNPAFIGKTYAFTALNGKLHAKPKEEWIEIPDVTPAIISQELFDAAQKQLQTNQDRASRNCRYEYLLSGHVRCRECGKAYVGSSNSAKQGGYRYYHCTGKQRIPGSCHNKMWRADKLEAMVWSELSHYLSDQDMIARELDKQRHDAGELGVFQTELTRTERWLKALDREQHQLLQWALKDFPADQVETENRRINKTKELLKAQKTELETRLRVSQNAVINVPNLERFIEDIQKRLPELDFEGKRLALDMLGITIWIAGENVEVTGIIEPENTYCITTKSF